jgi:cytochrome c oxidase subunit 2
MKESISNYAHQVDDVFLFIVIISAVILIGVTVTMIYFVYKYNKKRHPVAVNIENNLPLEITWITIPTLLVLGMFYYGFTTFTNLRIVPKNAIPINVQAQQWKWTFKYENGKKYDTLYVPVGKPLKLILTSIDVNHSFYVPHFRIKEDVVPGRENYLSFIPDKIGVYEIACAEYCGLRHSYMYNQLHVIPVDEFNKWVNQK